MGLMSGDRKVRRLPQSSKVSTESSAQSIGTNQKTQGPNKMEVAHESEERITIRTQRKVQGLFAWEPKKRSVTTVHP